MKEAISQSTNYWQFYYFAIELRQQLISGAVKHMVCMHTTLHKTHNIIPALISRIVVLYFHSVGFLVYSKANQHECHSKTKTSI